LAGAVDVFFDVAGAFRAAHVAFILGKSEGRPPRSSAAPAAGGGPCHPARPSAGCVPSPYTTGDLTCTNAGTVNTTGTDGIDAPANNGNATTTNSGNVNVSAGVSGGVIGIRTTTDIGYATTNNSGNVNVTGSGFNFGIVTSTTFSPGVQFGADTAPDTSGNTATTNNSGNVNVTSTGAIGILTTTATSFVTSPGFGDGIFAIGNATTTNSGNVVVNGTLPASILTQPGDSLPLFGISLGTVGIQTSANLGDATTNNSGTVSVAAFRGTGILTSTNTGNATTINSGVVNVVGAANNLLTVCAAPCGSSVGIVTSATNGNATLINSGIITVSGTNSVGVSMVSSGTSLLVNSGIISASGGTAIQFTNPLDPDTLTLLPGSFIVGAINLIGVDDTVNVNAGNLNLTFNTLAGATITGNVPFVVSGNRIVSVDPTGFAATDRALMDFTRAVSATLGGRASDAAISGGAATGALGFAAHDDSTSRFEDAFAQVMGYAKAPDNAIVFKNPTVTAPDGTTVWAKGFYGQRTQQGDGPLLLRNVSQFYGGAIGVDRLVQPDLRLGGFVGGGTINTSIDLNSGSGASDIVFAGLYGRKDFGPTFVDFALLGGHTGNRTTRNINNNLLANGLEVATASFGGWFISPEVAAGYRYEFAPGWTLTPAARLRYLAANYDAFTESGSTANLSAGSRSLQNAEERGDLTLTRTMPVDLGRLQLGLTVGVLGQQRTGSGNVNTTLLGQALAFATPGKSSIYGGYGGGSLDWRMRNGLSVFAAAEYTAMSDSSNTVTGKAGLRYGF
jgi:uncharacterized protein with beta-barrel porin domain